jgi:hypothetical protein
LTRARAAQYKIWNVPKVKIEGLERNVRDAAFGISRLNNRTEMSELADSATVKRPTGEMNANEYLERSINSVRRVSPLRHGRKWMKMYSSSRHLGDFAWARQ